MAKYARIVLPDDDYAEMNAAEMEYDGGSAQANADPQAAQAQSEDSASVKDIAISMVQPITQMAMMYFMFGGAANRAAAAPGQPSVSKPAAPKKQAVPAPSRISSISSFSFISDSFDNNIPESVIEWNRKKKC